MDKAHQTGISKDLWGTVNDYACSILRYLSATGKVGGFTWYTTFVQGVEDAIRLGFGDVGETVWREAGIGGNPRQDLISAIDSVLDIELPKAFESVSKSYAAVRVRFL
jgi:hypothetical protein